MVSSRRSIKRVKNIKSSILLIVILLSSCANKPLNESHIIALDNGWKQNSTFDFQLEKRPGSNSKLVLCMKIERDYLLNENNILPIIIEINRDSIINRIQVSPNLLDDYERSRLTGSTFEFELPIIYDFSNDSTTAYNIRLEQAEYPNAFSKITNIGLRFIENN